MKRPVTLITGASSGLGAGFAEACAKRGDEVVLVARRRDRLEEVAGRIGAKAHVLVADLTEAGEPERILAEIAALDGWIETLINNAGFGLVGTFAALPSDRQREMLRLNIEALTMLTHLALPAMLEQHRGAILNIASTAAFQPGPGMAVYFASKAFVLSFTEALHQELKGKGIKVSALCPGPTATEFGEVSGMATGRFDHLAAGSDGVVAAGMKGLERNRAVVVPGLMNVITSQSSRLLPRALMRRIVASLKL
jgi:short-subunit dehydrogenase